jgi:co-chaperonin GroES (HSP10)
MRAIQRLRSDWMLVKLEPEKMITRGGIITGTIAPEPVRIGKVLMAGPGRQYSDKFNPMPEGMVGKRIAFMIFASKTKQGGEIRDALMMDSTHELARLGDCLFEILDDQDIDVRKTQ